MEKGYLIEDLQKILGKERTQTLRFAKAQGWKVKKVIIDKRQRNVYDASDVDAYRATLLAVKKEKEKKVATRTVAKREAKAVDELPAWNQRVANSRFVICMKLEEEYEEGEGSKEEIINRFIKEAKDKYPQQMEILKKLSVPTLRRWYGVYIKNKHNPLALASGHGTARGIRRVRKEIIETAKALYYTKNKVSFMYVFERLIALYGDKCITYGTLRNIFNKDINIIEKEKARMGAKEFKDTYEPHIIRSYEDIKAGEVWMSDGHTLELMCYQGNRKKNNGQRFYSSPTLIVWIDVKSRFITGWSLSWTETTEAIAIALKNGIEKYGLPEHVYTDNGKAYKSKVLKGTEELDGIYASAGIDVSHARKYNAQAKHIERWFVDFKESFAKQFYTYKGGNIVERPEHMKSFALEKIAKGEILEQWELEEEIAKFIERKNHYYYLSRRNNGLKGHRGKGMHNRTPLEVFTEENPVADRKMLTEQQLRLLFLYEEIRTVQQNGIEFMENFYQNEYLYYHQTEKVKIKYDPHNLKYIYVYLDSGEFLCRAEQAGLAGWKDVTAIKTHKKRLQKIRKLSTEVSSITEEIRDDLNLIYYNDKQNIEEAQLIEEKKEETKMIEKKNKVHIGNGIYVDV